MYIVYFSKDDKVTELKVINVVKQDVFGYKEDQYTYQLRPLRKDAKSVLMVTPETMHIYKPTNQMMAMVKSDPLLLEQVLINKDADLKVSTKGKDRVAITKEIMKWDTFDTLKNEIYNKT